jgi:heat shock protein HtpX
MNAFFIFPAAGKGIATLFATHPPLEKRIEALERIEAQLQAAPTV